MTAWTKEEMLERPEELVLDAGNNYIQRRNIVFVETDGDKPEHYECDMRFISVAEYEMLKAMQNIVSGVSEV